MSSKKLAIRRHNFGGADAARRTRVGYHFCRIKANLFVNTRITAGSCPHSADVSKLAPTSEFRDKFGKWDIFSSEANIRRSLFDNRPVHLPVFEGFLPSRVLFSPLLHLRKRLSCNLSSAEQFIAVWTLCSRVQNGFICNVKSMTESINP